MDSKEKIIISKLVKLAEKQQKILTRLAQATQEEDVEGTKAYLKGAWETAALNAGITPVRSPDSIEYIAGGPVAGKPHVSTGSTYTITGVIPEDKRLEFKNTFERQLAAQKQELVDRVGMIFKDPQ
jgi:hypothetical protein